MATAQVLRVGFEDWMEGGPRGKGAVFVKRGDLEFGDLVDDRVVDGISLVVFPLYNLTIQCMFNF